MRLFSLVALSATLACGAVFTTVNRSSGRDQAESRPSEQDAHVFCSGNPCNAVPIARSYRDRYSRTALAAGTALDLGMAVGGTYAVSRTGNAGSGALMALGIAFILTDASFLLVSSHPDHDVWSLPETIEIEWNGQRTPISIFDVERGGSVRNTFSVKALRDSLDRDQAGNINPDLCSRDLAPIPRKEGTVVALFDPDVQWDLPPASLTSFSEAVRSRASRDAPEIRLLDRSAMEIAFSTTGKPGPPCDDLCRTRVAAQLGATMVATATLGKRNGEWWYHLEARPIRSPPAIMSLWASGRTLEESADALRIVAGWLFGCRR